MKKLFTLLTLALISIGSAWGDDYVIDGSLTFSSNACTVNEQTFTFSGTVTASQTSNNITIDSKKVLKLGTGDWTISLPENFQVTSLYIEGMSNNTGTTSTVSIGSESETFPVRPSSKTNYDIGADNLGKLTYNYSLPASESVSFNISGKESLLRIVITGKVETATYALKTAEKTGNKAYLANENSSISGSVLSFKNDPFIVEGTNIQSGNGQYKFTIGTAGDFTGVKYAANETYQIKPQAGITITEVKAYGSSNANSTATIESGTGNSISLAARGTANTPVTMSPLTLQKDGEGYYFFKITEQQSIIALEVTYTTAEYFTVKVSSAGYATLFYDKDLTIPAGVEAYYGKMNGAGDAFEMTQITSGKIPANTGVILKAAAGTYNFLTTSGAEAIAAADNDLTGATTATAVAANSVYTLGQNGEGVVGMRVYSGTSIRAYSAYITGASPAREFVELDIDGYATGIKKIDDVRSKKDDVYYDLQGRRVLYPTKGLYIVNGKKVIVK